jgi:hypothetical protein
MIMEDRTPVRTSQNRGLLDPEVCSDVLTQERLTALEARIAAYDTLVAKLIAHARTTAKGRFMLMCLGLA